MKRILLIYGGVAGLLCTLTLILSTWFGRGSSLFTIDIIIGYASIALSGWIIIKGMRKIAEKRNYKFNLLFGTGISMLLIVCTMYTAGWMAFYHSEAIDFKRYYQSSLEESWYTEDLSEEEMNVIRTDFEREWNQYIKPLNMAIHTFSEPFLPGLLIILVASAFLSAYEGGMPTKNVIE